MVVFRFTLLDSRVLPVAFWHLEGVYFWNQFLFRAVKECQARIMLVGNKYFSQNIMIVKVQELQYDCLFFLQFILQIGRIPFTLISYLEPVINILAVEAIQKYFMLAYSNFPLINICNSVKLRRDLLEVFHTVWGFRIGDSLNCNRFNFAMENILRKVGVSPNGMIFS